MDSVDEMDESSDVSGNEGDQMDDEDEVTESKVYLPGKEMDGDEELVRDESAYVMYHEMQTGAPCLSFDILRDNLGDSRDEFPLTCYIAAGTQSERGHPNHLIVMKMENLTKSKKSEKTEEEIDSESEESEDEGDLPDLETAAVMHTGSINRIRTANIGSKNLTATWSDNGKVYMWDVSRPLSAVDDENVMTIYTRNQESPKPIFMFQGHQIEGFAMDWSRNVAGQFASGDCKKNIHLWQPQEGGSWHVDQRPLVGHTASVEDLQWSPNEANVLASCSVDKSIRIWDARASPIKACMLTSEEAHDRDVNVLNWNHKEPFLVSGGDDGILKIWDLRLFQKGKPVAAFKHHTAPITSVEWNPSDSSVFAASGSDNQISIWDLSVERDINKTEEEPDVPPQLLFIHQGQTDIKEVHWHTQLPGVIISTALSGFNIFRTISV